MSKSLEFLARIIDDNRLNKIVNGCIQYPKTDDLKDIQPMITLDFGPKNLPDLNSTLLTNIDLKYLKLTDDMIFLINSIEKFRFDLLVPKADNIIIVKNNFVLAKLVNASEPKSGRSIKIDIATFRNIIEYTSNEILNKRLVLGFGVGVFSLMLWRVFS